MRTRHIPLGDRDEAGKARLGSQHIVIAGIQGAFCHAVSEGKHVAFGVIKKTKIHFVKQGVQLCNHVFQALSERFSLLSCAPQHLRDCFQLTGCLSDFRRCLEMSQAHLISRRRGHSGEFPGSAVSGTPQNVLALSIPHWR